MRGATLYELLLHEAGFATDRDAERLQRWMDRRRTLWRAGVVATRLVSLAAAAAALLELTGHLGFLPTRVYVLALAAATFDLVVEVVDKRLEPERKRGWRTALLGQLVLLIGAIVRRLLPRLES